MKTIILLITLYLCSHADTRPSTLFEQKCSICHMQQRPHADLMETMVAPPIMGVMKHVKEAKPTRNEAVAFVADYVFNPTRDKAVCQPQAIQRFGLMPSQKGNLTKEEALIIAEYLYDNFGSRGMGRNR
ncbi:MAG: cytochrome c [Campylobacterales bacterium]|nr:cytochrome c [Campylobacterales bacterium]